MTASPAGRREQAAAEALVAARACYGWLLACAPRQMIRVGTPWPPGRRAVLMTRVLGGRHLVQALLTATGEAAGLPPATVLALGAAVDVLHAASMAGLAAMYRPLRHVALADTAIESGFAAFGAATAWRSGRQPDPWAAAT
ncbi:MAG TPA: hypothetical protein VGM53_19125 [Streptosporangiaceae bacterium]